MGEPERDPEVEKNPEEDPEARIKKINNALTMGVDSSHNRRRNALYARRKDAGLLTTQSRSAKLHAPSSSLLCTLQIPGHLRTS
jgi:hypothetical protein